MPGPAAPSSAGAPTGPTAPGRAPAAPATGTGAPPVAPAAAETLASGGTDGTRPFVSPIAGAVIDQLLDAIAVEAEALLAGGDAAAERRLADLQVVRALIAWDVADDADAAARHLELAAHHPLAPVLRLAAAVDAGDGAALAALEPLIDQVPAQRRTALFGELGEAYLYRVGDAGRAHAIVQRIAEGDALAAVLASDPDLAHLAAVAASAACDDAAAAAAIVAASDARAPGQTESGIVQPAAVASAVAALLDRRGDAAAALDRAWGALARGAASRDGALGSPEALHWLRVVDLAIEAAIRADDPRLGELLGQRDELLASEPGAATERAASQLLGALDRGRRGGAELALATLMPIADGTVEPPGLGARAAALAALYAAVAADRRRDVIACRERLARPSAAAVIAAGSTTGGAWTVIHTWRVVQLADAGDRGRDPAAPAPAADDVAAITRHYDRVAAILPAAELARIGERLYLGDPAGLAALLEGEGGAGLRRAAAVVETRLGDGARALRLLRARVADGHVTRAELQPLARLCRRGRDAAALAEIYERLAAATDEPRERAAYGNAAGAMHLTQGALAEAERVFAAVAGEALDDLASRVAIAGLLRRGQRWSELVAALAGLAETVTSPALRGQLIREHAEVLVRHLDDSAGGRALLETALAAAPDDVHLLRGLAVLYDAAADFTRAAELRRRGLALVPAEEPLEQAELLVELGRTEVARGEDIAALAAFDRAAALDPASIDAIRGQIDVHRRAGRTAMVVGLLGTELARDPSAEPAQRIALHLEIAELTRAEADPSAALAAWLEVLALDPGHTAALEGVEPVARASGRWDVLSRALRPAPRTPARLAALAEALERTSQWTELAAVRHSQLDAAATPGDKAQLALALAGLYERELGQAEQALRVVELAHQAQPSHSTHLELIRLLEAAGRFPELAGALERELASLPAGAIDRQIEILNRLGDLRSARLGKPADAALAYEAILERRPGDPDALVALEAIYGRLGRDKDLVRVLEARADAVADPKARAPIYLHIAKLRQHKNDVDGAIAAYACAVEAEPSNREVFTALERLCYKHERWAAVLRLYDVALADVERGTRSYRLGDLYARKGQVQLEYQHELAAAAASYARVVELDPADEAAVIALRTIAERTGDWTVAVDALEKRAEHVRDTAQRIAAIRQAAALAADKLADPGLVVRLYHRILALAPQDADALVALEAHHEKAGEWAKVIDVLRMRLLLTPPGDQQLEMIRRIAQISEDKLRDVDVATEHYTRVLAQDPTQREALEALARIYESTEQWAEFVDITRRQIKVTTDRNVKALLYFKCGSVMEAKFGREEDAIRYYDAAIKTTATCMPAVHGMRDLYRRREDWPRVIQTLELEVKLWTDDKERAGVFAQIGRIHDRQLGDPERAMQFYESALAVDPDCVPANQALFEHFFDANDWGRAAPLAQALAQKAMREGDPQARSDFYWRRGVVLEQTDDARSGAESFIVALEIRPTNATALEAMISLARRHPDAYDFAGTLHELEKQYKKRDDAGALLARVYVGQAQAVGGDGDLDAAGVLYGQAGELAPGDFVVLSSLLDHYCDLRRWRDAVDAITRFLDASPPPTADVRIRALARRAEIHGEGEMNPAAAVAVLGEILAIDPAEMDTYYQLAQQYYLLGRFTDARAAIDRVIELSTAPGGTLSPPALARYYYYKGRIMEAAGDQRGAAPQYRRATEYDPGYAPPALVLARRSAEAGDQRQAETMLIDAAHAAMELGGPEGAVPLQRGLARILLAAGDRQAAIEAYRGILNVEPDGASDRVALAEIYAVDDPPRAIHELRKVIDHDIHNAPAYRLLASFYSRVGEVGRAARVLSVMEQLGYAEDSDRQTASRLRATTPTAPLRRVLDDDLRAKLLLNRAATEPLGEIFAAAAEEITALFPAPPMGERLAPIQTFADPEIRALVADVAHLYGTDCEVYIGDRVPGMAAAMAFPRRVLVIDRALLDEDEPAKRYLLGWALDAIRGGYALVLQLGARQRRELASLMRALVQLEAERPTPANDFVRSLPRRAKMVVDRHAGRVVDPDADAWLDGMIASAKRGGLLACDDFPAATWMVARLAGETPDRSEGTRALGAVLGGADLVRFFVSDDYSRLRAELEAPPADPRLSPG